jgi:hypothetical protein
MGRTVHRDLILTGHAWTFVVRNVQSIMTCNIVPAVAAAIAFEKRVGLNLLHRSERTWLKFVHAVQLALTERPSTTTKTHTLSKPEISSVSGFP